MPSPRRITPQTASPARRQHWPIRSPPRRRGRVELALVLVVLLAALVTVLVL